MKELFFFLLSVYLQTLIFGAFVSIFRFWKDVKRFHPKEEKEPKFDKKAFEQSIVEKASYYIEADFVVKEAVENG